MKNTSIVLQPLNELEPVNSDWQDVVLRDPVSYPQEKIDKMVLLQEESTSAQQNTTTNTQNTSQGSASQSNTNITRTRLTKNLTPIVLGIGILVATIVLIKTIKKQS